MNQRSAAVIIKDGKILLMHRLKPGRDYYAIPGGTIEAGETPEVAAIREVKEETGLDVEIDFLLFEFEHALGHEYFYVVKNIKGEATLGGPELERNSRENFYELKWVELGDIEKTPVLPPAAKEKIIEYLVKN